ncbi:hypothetical protein [Streptomyces sp. NPDC058657]|uniref:hypothetical protein n=1 Tax=unclassified Streptomyces TaxID=2593676 RepID=UPI00364721AE
MPAAKKTTAPPPPAEAVARDPHWTATREKLRNRLRPTATLTICDDHQAKERLSAARYVERRAQEQVDANNGNATFAALLEDAQRALADAQQAFDDAAIVLRFQALERLDFEALKKAHPPTEEQAEEGTAVNVETLGPELIAASSLDGITPDEAREYLETWAEGEATALFNTPWALQSDSSRVDVGKG